MNERFAFSPEQESRIVYVRPVRIEDLPAELRQQAMRETWRCRVTPRASGWRVGARPPALRCHPPRTTLRR
ncbi:MAG: hypothetical protein ACE368_06355 [Paracoccaceae bacterium]